VIDELPAALALVTGLALAILAPERAGAQEAGARQGAALRVYLDCDRCDFDFLRQESTFVDYVRDPRDAQVHVLVTTQRAGGGREFRLEFIGREEFEGIDQVHRFVRSQTDTDDEERRRLKTVLEVGLAGYALGTPLAESLSVSYEGSATIRPEEDPWNFWLFQVRGSGFVSGESQRQGLSAEGELEANRTTEAWRIEAEVEGFIERDRVELQDEPEFESTLRDFTAGAQVVKSIGPHWGVGVGGSLTSSTFINLDFSPRIALAAEYNVYPYEESSQRRFTASYFLGATDYNYREETIFGKTGEFLADQGLIVSFDTNQTWGRARIDLEGSHFLSDFSKNRLSAFGLLELRITRGLSLNVFGRASRVRDQVFLPARELTDEEILLQRLALATDFTYFVSFGISYTFGSIFNSAVNARLSGPSGGFHEISGRRDGNNR